MAITLVIKDVPTGQEVDIDDLTENGILEMIQECDTLKERLEERQQGINNDLED